MTMHKPLLRTWLIVSAAAFAIITPIAQALRAFGLSAAEFSSSGDSTLRAEGYAFAIWGLIYVGLGVYAIWQALPATKASAALDRFGWPSVIAMAGCGLWLLAAAADARWATVAIISVSALALMLALARGPIERGPLWIIAPLGLLGGWLTIATALNTLTVLTSFGRIPETSANIWAVGGIAIVIGLGALILRLSQNLAYGAAIAWGLAGVIVAEYAHRPEAAWAAGAGVLLILVMMAAITGAFIFRQSPLKPSR